MEEYEYRFNVLNKKIDIQRAKLKKLLSCIYDEEEDGYTFNQALCDLHEAQGVLNVICLLLSNYKDEIYKISIEEYKQTENEEDKIDLKMDYYDMVGEEFLIDGKKK